MWEYISWKTTAYEIIKIYLRIVSCWYLVKWKHRACSQYIYNKTDDTLK